MKRHWKRALSAALAVVLAAGVLGGCTAAAVDPIKEMMGEESGITSETVMFTVNGSEVTAGDYFFWLGQSASDAVSYSQMLGEENVDWNSEVDDGTTMADYVKDTAKQQAVLYNVVTAKAMENGYEITKEDEAAYMEELNEAKENLGGEEAYNNWLKSNCLTEEGMEKLSSVGVLFDHMLAGMFQEGSENAPSPEDLTAYATEKDLLVAKHILLLTQDTSTGTPLSEEEIAQKRATAEDLLAQLKAIQDPEELETTFDSLMQQYSEDTGLAENPDGYTFTAGQMVPEFENATRALEYGQVSDIVESDYGYHIILRVDPSQSESLRSQWAKNELNSMVQQWVDEAEIEDTEAFTNLDMEEFYNNLTAYQATFNDTEEADQAESDQPQEEAQAPEEGESQEALEEAKSQAEAQEEAQSQAEAQPQEETQAEPEEAADDAEPAA